MRVLLLAVAIVLGWAAPAAADPPAPTEWRSEVVSVDPEVEGIEVEVAGGDGFLVLTVEEGHEAIVYGYPEDEELEEYLRFSADGTVERNLRSPATYLNEDRFADIEVPGDLQPGDEPVWEVVATGGRYAWHDHRIHFMGTVVPEGAFEEPTPWELPIAVDGTDVVVSGTLQRLGPSSPLPWVLVAVVVAGALVLVGARASRVALVVASAAAVAVSVATLVAVPPGAGSSGGLIRVVLTAVALLAALVALARAKAPAGAIAALAAVALLAGWALLRVGVLTNPVLPTDLPFDLDRAATAAAIGTAIAAAVVVVRGGALRLPELTDDE